MSSPRRPIGIPAAVRPLVVELDDRDVRREEGHRPQHARAEHRVLLDDVELGRGQRARLPQHVVGDADLADVVQQRAEAHDLDVGGRQVELPADGHRQHADAVRVPGGVRIARVERRRERADRARVRGLRLRLGLRRPMPSAR